MKKYLFTLLIAFVLSLFFCALLIPLLRKWRAGQNILSYVKEHKKKSGTPTMGGLAFIPAAVIAAAVWIEKTDRVTLVSLVIGLAYMAVGFLDDLLKKKHKENLGLKAWQKFSFQSVVALLAGVFCMRQGLTRLYIPFTSYYAELGGWTIPLVVFVFLSTVNAVNLTDGLDGLAAGVSLPFFAVISLIIALEGGEEGLSMLGFAIVGALIGYLFFNSPPASVFMGDTGSLGLGGFAACIACFSGNALYILIVGCTFVVSVISVIIQVIYYKATGGKRVFLMSPVHHHFQQKGYSESKISYAYAAVTAVLGAACLTALL